MRRIVEFLKSNLWLIPTSIVIAFSALALFLIKSSRNFSAFIEPSPWKMLFVIGPEGAREMLSVIAGSVMTVAGVAFSITMVVLSMASNQFSPRVLRSFMSDWKSQSVLGGFLGIFAYCLITLRTIRSNQIEESIPSLAIFGSVLLSFLAITLIIYFIHHVANEIRATNIVRSVFEETSQAIDTVFPDLYSHDDSGHEEVSHEKFNHCIPSFKTGYLQSVNFEKLTNLAKRFNARIRVESAPGEFIQKEATLIRTTRTLQKGEIKKVLKCVLIGSVRTMEQDIQFGTRQLVDVALKGLSPGINDTTTAIIAIDHLGALVSQLALRNLEFKHDGIKNKLIFIKKHDFKDYLDQCFDQIRQYAENNPFVLGRLQMVYENIMSCTEVPSRLKHLEAHQTKLLKVLESHTPHQDYNVLLSKMKSQIDLCHKREFSNYDREIQQ